MTRIEFWGGIGALFVAVVGLFVTLVVMFNGVNARFDTQQTEMNRRFDTQQAETNARFDAHQAETSRRFEAVDARFDQMFDRMDRMQAESNRRFDATLETIAGFDRRLSHLEGRLDGPDAEDAAP